MTRPTFVRDPHNTKRKWAWLSWFGDLRCCGPYGRRHERKCIAWNLGWRHQQNETEDNDPVSSCPWSKRVYVSEYEKGRDAWWNVYRKTKRGGP